MPGSDNYNFTVPLTSLPGRGLDVSLSLTYNSSIWHKMGVTGNRLHFDVDKTWPAPGFRLGYGHLETQSNGSFVLVDPDGTRHQMVNDVPYPYPPSYITTDGTFIRATGEWYKTLTYSDGTQVFYGAYKYAPNNTIFWPTRITDRHGNYLTINYPTDANGTQFGPRILSIVDTLGRYIRFYYDSNNNLVTITAPGYAENSDRQEARFFYETITDFTNKAKFATGVTVNNRPSSIQVIKYIYFPGTQGGQAEVGAVEAALEKAKVEVNPYHLYNSRAKINGMATIIGSLRIGSIDA
jgi:YD repeat-containing protein